MLREVPGATLAHDSAGRVTDIAIDHSEFAQLDDAPIERVVALMRAEGLHATVSSIHVNGWIGEHDKLSGARWIVRAPVRPRPRRRAASAGSTSATRPTTRRCSATSRCRVGVANLRRFADRLHTWPAYITEGERGAGFAEVAQALLAARRGA